ncbi:MAG: PH domain-containing protein [Egibacteraceae bacterium]
MTPSDPAPEPPPAPPAPPLGGRLHPAAIGVWTVGAVGPLLFFVIAGGPAQWLASVGLGLSAVAGVVRWLRFIWRIDGAALLIDHGLLQRQRRVIPLERIQSVEVVRKLRHRLFGVTELRVETVGGASTEGHLDALDPRLADHLRDVLLRRVPVDAGREPRTQRPTVDEPVLAHLRPARLVVAGLTGGRVGIAAAVFGVGQDFLGDRFERWLPRVDLTRDLDGVLAFALVVAIGAFTLSIVATLLTYWNFTLTSTDGALRVRRGLLEQRTDTIPLRRVQTLRLQENLLRRWLGLAAVTVDVAGRGGEAEEAKVSGLLLPLATRSEALALIERVMDRPGLARIPVRSMPRGARDRRLVRAALLGVVATGAGVLALRPTGAALALVLVPAAAVALAAYGGLGHAAEPDLVVARSGWLVRTTAFVPRARLQSLALRQSAFQRRRGLATLALQIARGRGSSDPRMIDLDEALARRLLATLTQPSQPPVTVRE